ncbi:hypothetical protein CCH79_00003680 [Gambusia affinis]|uniref:Multiple epidermal growth factor-like domains protein 6 n=1 Tax=Gambusia affinis TaxID=33528 RepID=A0A315VA25_GAMAF|nr:hypothetical protein CCH79_00003680 [Gambusia affinis]
MRSKSLGLGKWASAASPDKPQICTAESSTTAMHVASSADLQLGMPNVCANQEVSMLGVRQPCVQAFTRMMQVWKQGCTGRRWCVGFERRTAYYTAYRQAYSMDFHTVYKCCPGWAHKDNEMGCLHRVCSANACLNGGRCAETGERICHCPLGFKGPRCQYDINECEVDEGGCEGYCCNTIGSYYCKCPEGSKVGPDGKACNDINECDELNGGCQQTCVNTAGSYHCECSEGFRMHSDGRTCVAVNSCSILNGGCEHKCVDVGNNEYKCECRRNYQLKRDGRHCELRDLCKERNGGCAQFCNSEGGKANCSCRSGFMLSGDQKNCEDIDECSSGHAKCSHGCINMLGSFRCVCHPGFELGAEGKQCYRIEMEIVNSCEKNNGGCSHHCEHVTNGPLCSCNQGYRLDTDRRTCVDSDECLSVESCCSHLCRNYPGGYECSCRAGHRLSPDGCGCEDINECLAETSGCEHYCINTLGTYQCFCRIGFRLDLDQHSCISLYGSELDEEEEEGLEAERLPDLLFRKAPQLLHYTAGLHVRHSTDNNDDDDDDDDDDGRHVSDSDEELEIHREHRGELRLESTIVCLEGSFGDDCSVSCDDCVNGACSENMDQCDCSPGWTGIICNETCHQGSYGKSCNSMCHCLNGGSCDPVTGKCLCPLGVNGQFCEDGCLRGYFGKNCRRKCNCPNNGPCHRLYGACLCSLGLYGRFCHLACPKWTHGAGCSKECKCVQEQSSGCDPKTGSCFCKPAYHGLLCDKECDPGFFGAGCEQSCDCPGGGSCDPKTGLCSQRCPAGLQGDQCQLACQTGNYGENCRLTCDCGGASCDPVTGECDCPAGKRGSSCQEDCPDGFWGLKCQFSCSVCENSGSCNKQTGICNCKAGSMGNLCQEACEPGFWGQGCIGRCQCQDRSVGCDPVSGRCVCEPGYTGDNCEDKCVNGHYGHGCAQKCLCKNEALCDHVSGACICSPGFTGYLCEKISTASTTYFFRFFLDAVCLLFDIRPEKNVKKAGIKPFALPVLTSRMFYLGPQRARTAFTGLTVARCASAGTVPAATTSQEPACAPPAGQDHTAFWVMEATSLKQGNAKKVDLEKTAVRPVSVRMRAVVTTSLGDAAAQMVGLEPTANSCPPGHYGEQCSNKCLCQNGGFCHSVTGQCSCPPGHTGAACELECEEGNYGENCTQTCGCLNGGSCDKVTGKCLCLPGWIGENCQSEPLYDRTLTLKGRWKERPSSHNLNLWLHFFSNPCSEGFFGDRCERRCDCAHSSSCHHMTGRCECRPGWRGARIEDFPEIIGFPSTDHQPAFLGSTALPVPGVVSAALGCPVTTRRGVVAAQLDSRGSDVRKPALLARSDKIAASCADAPGSRSSVIPRQGNAAAHPATMGHAVSFVSLLLGVEPVHLGQTASPSAPASMAVAVTLGLGHAIVIRATLELTAVLSCACAGCPGGYYGKDCAKLCSCAEGAQCHPVTGRCICGPGRTGASCQQACPKGRYGLQCRYACSCQNGAVCDPVDGSCKCGLGWTGPQCETACPAGKYGPDCAQHCQCLNNATCRRFTGSCSCTAGYYGDYCQHGKRSLTNPDFKLTHECFECPSGFYGLNCQFTCDCNMGQACDHVTGKCLCPPGFYGSQCERQCENGSFGLNCMKSCNCADEASCDPSTGRCLCLSGQWGERCEKSCDGDHFGPNCSLLCQCFHGSHCDRVNGRCLCPLTWLGSTCSKAGHKVEGCKAEPASVKYCVLKCERLSTITLHVTLSPSIARLHQTSGVLNMSVSHRNRRTGSKTT